MNEPESTTTSNLAIKAVCIIGFINATQMITLIFSPMTKQLGSFYPTFFSLSILLSLICLVGLWLLKKSAAIAYITILAINQLVLLKMGFWEATAIIMPMIITALVWQDRSLLG